METNVQKSITEFVGNSECFSHPNHVVCDICDEDNTICECKKATKFAENEKGVYVDKHVDANSSFTHSVVNMVGMLLGLGQLSTPYALENGGWASAFLLIGLGIICTYTSILLGKCMNKNPKSRTYTDIGNDAFRKKGSAIASTLICAEIFMALVSYTISLHDNLKHVFSGTKLGISTWTTLSDSQLLTTVAVMVALPTLWLKHLSSISFLSSGGILMSIIIFSSVAWTAIFGGIKADHEIPVLRLHKVPAISGLYIFSYAGHIVFPNLYKSMRDPSQFTKASIVSFGAVTFLYTALAFMGASMFGSKVCSQITLSMPSHLIVTKIALWATVITPMTKYALEFAPFALQLEHNLPNSMSRRTKLIIRGSVGSLLLLLILAIALSVPYFEHVLSLTGSLVSVAICIVLPCAFYSKISWTEISTTTLILNFLLIAFGTCLGAFGTISSSKSLSLSVRRRD